MTLIADHAYEKGPFGRCVICNKRQPAHEPSTFDPPLPAESTIPAQLREYIGPVISDTIRVTVHTKAQGRPGVETEVPWPRYWPLPVVGSLIVFDGQHGEVRRVTFDVDQGRIVLACT